MSPMVTNRHDNRDDGDKPETTGERWMKMNDNNKNDSDDDEQVKKGTIR